MLKQLEETIVKHYRIITKNKNATNSIAFSEA